MTTAITNCKIFTGDEVVHHQALLLNEGVVVGLIADDDLPNNISDTVDLKGNWLVPGFIDLQVNGGGGVMFNSSPTKQTILKMLKGHQQYGTTGFLPTLITDSYEVMRQAIMAVQQALDENIRGVLGIHLEGPFLNEAKKGAHDAHKFCKIDEQGFNIVTSLRSGKTIVTIAPELTDSSIVERLVKSNIIVCAGHSNADYDQTITAIEAGLSGFTHLYNAMTPLQSRAPGMVGAAISDEQTWFGIIADGFHMHPSAFKVAVKAKQKGGAILVTDAMATVGSDTDTFELNGEIIKAIDGKCENSAGSLAGSALNMNQAVKNAIQYANITPEEAFRMASLYPAQAIHMGDTLGKIAAGYKANFVALDKNFDVTGTWIEGNKV